MEPIVEKNFNEQLRELTGLNGKLATVQIADYTTGVITKRTTQKPTERRSTQEKGRGGKK